MPRHSENHAAPVSAFCVSKRGVGKSPERPADCEFGHLSFFAAAAKVRSDVASSEAVPIDHQIIFATAMIAPELDNPTYTVGPHSSLDSPSLNFG